MELADNMRQKQFLDHESVVELHADVLIGSLFESYLPIGMNEQVKCAERDLYPSLVPEFIQILYWS